MHLTDLNLQCHDFCYAVHCFLSFVTVLTAVLSCIMLCMRDWTVECYGLCVLVYMHLYLLVARSVKKKCTACLKLYTLLAQKPVKDGLLCCFSATMAALLWSDSHDTASTMVFYRIQYSFSNMTIVNISVSSQGKYVRITKRLRMSASVSALHRKWPVVQRT